MFTPKYGDAQFRRSDSGYTTGNPFVENLILDAFTTEPGADVTVRFGNFFVVGGVTTGENKGDINAAPNGLHARPASWARSASTSRRARASG